MNRMRAEHEEHVSRLQNELNSESEARTVLESRSGGLLQTILLVCVCYDSSLSLGITIEPPIGTRANTTDIFGFVHKWLAEELSRNPKPGVKNHPIIFCNHAERPPKFNKRPCGEWITHYTHPPPSPIFIAPRDKNQGSAPNSG